MCKLRLKECLAGKGITVLLPLVVSALLLVGALAANHFRAVQQAGESKTGTGNSVRVEGLPLSEPLRVACILHEKETVYITLMEIKPSGEIEFSDKTTPQAMEIFRDAGGEGVRALVQASYYAAVSFEGLRDMLVESGIYTSIYLPQAYTYTDMAGLQVTFPAGQVNVSGNQVPDLLYAVATDAQGGDIIAALHTDLFAQYISATQTAGEVYTLFVRNADTDIRIYDFTQHLPLIEAISLRKKE